LGVMWQASLLARNYFGKLLRLLLLLLPIWAAAAVRLDQNKSGWDSVRQQLGDHGTAALCVLLPLLPCARVRAAGRLATRLHNTLRLSTCTRSLLRDVFVNSE